MTSIQSRPRVAVVGAGVIGLSTAVCLAETYGRQLDITVIAEHFSPNTTSNRAVAIFFIIPGCDPFVLKHAPVMFHRLKYLHKLYNSEETGIRVLPMYFSYEQKAVVHAVPPMRDISIDHKTIEMSDAEKALGPIPDNIQAVELFKTFHINPSKYLAWLTSQFLSSDGTVVKSRVNSFSDLEDYDVIVNCTGLGAMFLTGDTSMYPVKGQIVTVFAPRVNGIRFHLGLMGKEHHIIPQGNGTVMLGGSAEKNEWTTSIDPTTQSDIVSKCVAIQPSLEGADVNGGWTGLRPGRDSVRLEVEGRPTGPSIVHNYGHGSCGFILSWGSAVGASRLACQCLRERGFELNPRSNL